MSKVTGALLANLFRSDSIKPNANLSLPNNVRPNSVNAGEVPSTSKIGQELGSANEWQRNADRIRNQFANHEGVQGKLAGIKAKKGTVRFFAPGDRQFKVNQNDQAVLERFLGKKGGDIARGVIDETAALLSERSFSPIRATEQAWRAQVARSGVEASVGSDFWYEGQRYPNRNGEPYYINRKPNEKLDTPAYHETRAAIANSVPLAFLSGIFFGPAGAGYLAVSGLTVTLIEQATLPVNNPPTDAKHRPDEVVASNGN